MKKTWIVFLILISCSNDMKKRVPNLNQNKEIIITIGEGFDTVIPVNIFNNNKLIETDTIKKVYGDIGLAGEYYVHYKNGDEIFIVIKKDTVSVNTKYSCFYIDKIDKKISTGDCTGAEYD